MFSLQDLLTDIPAGMLISFPSWTLKRWATSDWLQETSGKKSCSSSHIPFCVRPGPLFQGSWVITLKITRFGIQTGEVFWNCQFAMDFIKTWHTCAKNCFLLTDLLLEQLAASFPRIKSILKRKNNKKWQKMLESCHLKFYYTSCFLVDISITKNST